MAKRADCSFNESFVSAVQYVLRTIKNSTGGLEKQHNAVFIERAEPFDLVVLFMYSFNASKKSV